MFKKITTPGKSKGSKQEGKSAKKSKVEISPDSNTDVDESQVIIESDESLNLDIDLDQASKKNNSMLLLANQIQKFLRMVRAD